MSLNVPEVLSPVSALMNYSLAASDSMLNVTKLHLPTFSFTYREGVLSKSLDELRLCPDVLHHWDLNNLISLQRYRDTTK